MQHQQIKYKATPTAINTAAKSMLQLGIIIINNIPKPMDAAIMPTSFNGEMNGRGGLGWGLLIKYHTNLSKLVQCIFHIIWRYVYV